jgi:hypothetical protein
MINYYKKLYMAIINFSKIFLSIFPLMIKESSMSLLNRKIKQKNFKESEKPP